MWSFSEAASVFDRFTLGSNKQRADWVFYLQLAENGGEREQASEFLLRIERLMHPNLIGIAWAGKRCQALSSCIDCVGVLCSTFWTSAAWLSLPCTLVLATSFHVGYWCSTSLFLLYTLVPFASLHCTTPTGRLCADRGEPGPCPWLGFSLAPTASALSVSHPCPYHSRETPESNSEANLGQLQAMSRAWCWGWATLECSTWLGREKQDPSSY